MTGPKLKIVDDVQLQALHAQAAAGARRRKNLNLHERLDDPVQRLLNDFEPGTYVRPHRHVDKWELFVLVSGSAALLTFDDASRVRERVELGANAARVVEIPANTWHALVALEAGTVLFETKPGPYDPNTGGDFAPWSPPEGDAAAAGFVQRLAAAQRGDRVA
jgi:cupin fold WbuC family metalloprotein